MNIRSDLVLAVAMQTASSIEAGKPELFKTLSEADQKAWHDAAMFARSYFGGGDSATFSIENLAKTFEASHPIVTSPLQAAYAFINALPIVVSDVT